MKEARICSGQNNTCLVDQYCPSLQTTNLQCQTCSKTIREHYGCNCVDFKMIKNCLKCQNGRCVECIYQYSLQPNGTCFKCALDCLRCDKTQCFECIDGYNLNLWTNQCGFPCETNADCKYYNIGYCNKCLKICEFCDQQCTQCSTKEFCTNCYVGTTLFNGICTKQCINRLVDHYCLNGELAQCDENITSQCYCNEVQNCRTCNESKNGCASCMPHFIMGENDRCTYCESGFELVGKICSPVEDLNPICPIPSNDTIVFNILLGTLVALCIIWGMLDIILCKKIKNKKQ
ncbi:Cysteine-rich membrane protein 2 [Spironucleus salmonicida]|uniref:Cysteine-rich membrane protein 2 n=1 Tax=Spironucleus salmonicida TaxID=348837 RepID=V6LNS2_9EUKA|nr:Cysteine-rich membrane protein 2 [Spironucleus salmonicida]|eukprot:EST42384.1 Cysteine-rich membrane protein 2 [Spironucleus salmonicida]